MQPESDQPAEASDPNHSAATAPAEPSPDRTILDSLDAELADIEHAVERIEAGDLDVSPVTDSHVDVAVSNDESGPLQSGPPQREEHAMGF